MPPSTFLLGLGNSRIASQSNRSYFTIVLEPTGSNVDGAIGKMNLYFQGHRDEGIFLLLIEEDNEQLYWEMRESIKQLEHEQFSQKTFEQLIDKWSNKWSDKWADID